MALTKAETDRIDYEIDRHILMFNVVLAAREVVERNDADNLQRLKDALVDYDDFKADGMRSDES